MKLTHKILRNLLLSSLFAFILLSSFAVCNTVITAAAETKQATYTYSNLADQKTQTLVKKALLKAGLSEKDVSAWLKEVKLYNKAIRKKGLVTDGFKTVHKLPSYPEGKISELWNKNYPEFAGYDCRMTAYTLLKSKITVNNPNKNAKTNLVLDMSAIKDDPLKTYSTSDQARFRTLFNAVKAKKSKKISTHHATMTNTWKKRGVYFSTRTDAKLVSVVLHDGYEQELYIGHAGILIPYKKGYLFLEKLSFEMPYQVLKFQKKSELKNYLMAMYGNYTDDQSANPFVLINKKLL